MNKGYTRYFLKPGYIYFSSEPAIVSTVLGSSVAVTMYHRGEFPVGGIAHFVYPVMREDKTPSSLYAFPSVIKLLRMFTDEGIAPGEIEANIYGGAVYPEERGALQHVGPKNYSMAEDALEHLKVKLIGRDVGGTQGRKIVFDTKTGEIIVAKVNRIRYSDWYPGQEYLTTVQTKHEKTDVYQPRIVVIDDSEEVIAGLKHFFLLHFPDCRVDYFTDPVRGLLKIGEIKPAIVILDIEMEGMNGIEICRNILEDSSLAFIKIIVISGFLEKYSHELKLLNVSYALSKPFRYSQLKKVLAPIMIKISS